MMKASKPKSHVIAQLKQAISWHHQGYLPKAQWMFQQVLAVDPYNFSALEGMGFLLGQMGRFEEALNCFSRASMVRPNEFAVYFNCGTALKELGRYEDALVSFDKALSLNPNFAQAYCSRGSVLNNLQRYDEALASFDKAISCNVNYVNAYNNRGAVLHKTFKRHDEALASFNKAIALKPNFADAYYNRALLLSAMGQYAGALASYDGAIGIRPDYVDAIYNRAHLLSTMGQYEGALTNYDKAIGIRPDHVDANYNKALLKLLLGDYEAGWPLYEWRWKTDQLKNKLRHFKQGLWLGNQPVSGKTILLHAEQGFGDVIQMVRYVPMLEVLGAKVVLEAPASLVSLLRTLKTTFTLIEKGEELPSFDMHCPIMSLPLAFSTTVATIPAQMPYLSTDAHKQAEMHERFGARSKLRVGLVWSGNSTHLNDRNRSMPLSILKPLLDLDFEYHSLHKEVSSEDKPVLVEFAQIHSHECELIDYSYTAALIAEMDLVITVDTSVAHLAGALGKKVWILLPYASDFRWMMTRNDSPWYPTARLFRQGRIGDWEGVIADVISELQSH